MSPSPTTVDPLTPTPAPHSAPNDSTRSRRLLYVLVAVALAVAVAALGLAGLPLLVDDSTETISIGSTTTSVTSTDNTQNEPETSVDDTSSATTTAPATTSDGSAETTTPAETTIPADTQPDVEPGPSCSSAGLEPTADVSGLPEAVIATRAAIIDAAMRCDIAALSALTSPDFAASLGGGRADELWPEQELRGEGPLRILVALLSVPHVSVPHETGDGDYYVWPPFAVDDAPTAVPITEWEAWGTLVNILGQDQLAGWIVDGTYVGYRVTIDENGEWLLFLAGD